MSRRARTRAKQGSLSRKAAASLGVPKARLIPRAFYARETEVVARELLGAVISCRTSDGVATGRIVETEAYLGEHDGACHAAAGLTERTRPLYDEPGTAYVYFVYGMYWCVNAVTRERGSPSAVLIRAIEPLVGLDLMRLRRGASRSDEELTNGPGKLCMALAIDGKHNAASLLTGELTIQHGTQVPDDEVSVSPRIGITRAADWPLRYFVNTSRFVSRTPIGFAVTRFAPLSP